MAVAAMAWVEGIPYSASVRISSFTTGGERGRGHLRMSLETCPMYITIWGEEMPQAVSKQSQFPPCHPRTTAPSFSAAKSTTQEQNLCPELLKDFPLSWSVEAAVVLLHSKVTGSELELNAGFADETQQYRMVQDGWLPPTPHHGAEVSPLKPHCCKTSTALHCVVKAGQLVVLLLPLPVGKQSS